MKFLTTLDVIAIHEQVIKSRGLQGIAQNKSIEAVIARIDTRIQYGMVNDVYELAACYAVYIAVAHAFNDANKRTAFAAMDICLTINDIELDYNTIEVSGMIQKVAQGIVDEFELAQWLRSLAR